MGVYYHNRSAISRSTGGNAVASAAYRHAAKMTNDVTGQTRSYTGKADELVHEEIILPDNAPDWAVERYGGADVTASSEALWNDVEVRENQHNHAAKSRLAQSYTIALPRELSRYQQIELMREYISSHLVANGAVADLVIHDKGDGNPHAHVMTTYRTLGESGLDQRIRDFKSRSKDTVDLRFGWACAANHALERAGFEARIDHRRLEEQGIELGPLTYNHEIAGNVEANDAQYRVKMRVEEARAANEVYLMERPEHMLTVVAAGSPLFTEEDLEDGFKRYLPSSVGARGVAALTEQALASADLVSTGREDVRGGALYTTRALVEMSRQMEAGAAHLAGSWLGISDAGPVELDPALSEQQRVAVEAMVAPERLTLVTGYAGSGKTFAVKEAARVWSARGVEVLAGAVSGKAAQELAGIEGQVATLAQWEARWNKGVAPTEGKFVFIMDEAGMVGTAIWSRVQARIEQMGGKLIAVGDAAQLAPIKDTSAFLHLSKIARHVVIDEVRRQLEPGDRLAAQQLSQGGAKAVRALEYYRDRGAIVFAEHAEAGIAELAASHFDHGGAESIALTHRNADVEALNAALRKEAVKRGMVELKSQIALRNGDLKLAIGDRVRFTQAYREGGITKSSFATVLEASAHSLALSVDGVSGVQVIDTRVFDAFDYGYAATVHKSQGMSVDGHVSLLVTGGFDQHLLTVGLTRHQRSVKAYVAADEIDSFKRLCERAQQSGLLEVVHSDLQGATPRMGVDIADSVLGARADRTSTGATSAGKAVEIERYVSTAFEGDAVLSNEAMRVGGLLRSEFKVGDTPVGDDPRGYALDPLKVVDDLLAERGVLRPSEVAERLAEAVPGPDLFARLYVQAMSHPDLVILSERGHRGEGRIYSSVERVGHALELMDRGVTMACRQGPAPQLDLFGMAALSSEERRVADYMAWPARLGVVEEVGAFGLGRAAQAVATALGESGSDGRVIALGLNRGRIERFAERAGIASYDLYGFGQALKQGSLGLGAHDVVVMPDASGVHQDDLDVIMGLVEGCGAKLVLHHDPSVQAAGSIVRHLGARISTAKISGLRAVAPEWRGLLQGGDALRDSFEAQWNGDRIQGHASSALQREAFIDAYIGDPCRAKIAVVGGAKASAELNLAIEMQQRAQVKAVETACIERLGAASLDLHVGSRVLMARSRKDVAVMQGARGEVTHFGADGSVGVRFGDREVLFETPQSRSALEYGYAAPVHTLRGAQFDSVHGLLGRGARRADVTQLLQLSENIQLSLPVDVELSGAGSTFLEAVLSHDAGGSALDYGFDPKCALSAAADRLRAGPALALEAGQALLPSEAAQVAHFETQAHLRQNPEFIVADMMRSSTRFDQSALEHKVQSIFGKLEGESFDAGRFAERAIHEGLSSGVLLEAERRAFDGAQLYVTRVQAELEVRALDLGIGMARQRLPGIELSAQDYSTYDHSVLHGIGPERLSLLTYSARLSGERIIRKIGDVWRERGYQVVAASLTKDGAQQFGATLGGCSQSGSLSSLEAQWAMGRVPEQGRFVVVLDRAVGMDSMQWARVQERIDAMGGKLIAISGHNEIEIARSASMFNLLSREVGIGGAEPVILQHKEMHRVATAALRQRGMAAVRALDIYKTEGAVHFAAREEGAIAAIARAYWADGYEHGPQMRSKLAMAHSAASVQRLEDAIRAEGVRLGRLGVQEDHGGRTFSVGEVFTSAIEDTMPSYKVGDQLKVVGFNRDEVVFEVLGEGRKIELFSSRALDALHSNLASTIHAASRREVDQALVFASRGMDQGMYRSALSRHRESVQLHVPQTQLRDFEALSRAVQRNRDVDVLRALPALGSEQLPAPVIAPDILDRSDRSGSDLMRGAAFGLDVHLQQVAGRMSGLLGMGYNAGDPVLGDDPRHYALDPLKVVDDLLSERSVIRAEDVANTLSGVALEPRTFVRLFAEAMAHPDLVILSEQGQRGEGRVYSSLDHIRREVALVDKVTALALTPTNFTADKKALARAGMSAFGPMSPDQLRALAHVTSPTRIAMVTGYAGSGKSTLLSGVRDVYEHSGWDVIGAALSGDAAKGLEESSGIKSSSFAKLMYDARAERIAIGPKTLIVIDEAAMTNAEQTAELLDLVDRTGASLRLVGDPKQLQPRGPGAMWRSFEERIGSVTLDTVWRQRSDVDRLASKQLASGGSEAERALEHFATKGAITALDIPKDAPLEPLLERLAQEFSADPQHDKIMLAHRRDHVARLNVLARAHAQNLRPEGLPQLAVRSTGDAMIDVQAGDRIAFVQNHRRAGILNGDKAEIVDVNVARQSYTAKLGAGDEARFVTLEAASTPAIEYGYASTIHKSQGKTVESTHALVTGGYSHSLLYVAATRHRSDLKLYIPTSEDKSLDYLKNIARRDVGGVSTLEAGYGFDPSRAFEAAVQISKADGDTLDTYIARHDVAQVPARWSAPLARILSPADKTPLPAGTDVRALTEVIGAQRVKTGSGLEPELQLKALRILQDVSDPISWGQARRALPASTYAATEQIARARGHAPEGSDPLPQARAFARALAVSQHNGDPALTKVLRDGFDLLGARASVAAQNGGYSAMLDEAKTPARASKGLAGEIEPIVPAPPREQQAHSRAPEMTIENSHLVPLSSSALLGATSDVAIAKQVLRAFIGKNGPGFFETLAKEMRMDSGSIQKESNMLNNYSKVTKDKNRRALARSITSALTRYATPDSEIRERDDLFGDVLHLLERSDATIISPKTVASKALEIAKARSLVTRKVELLEEFGVHPSTIGIAVAKDENPFDLIHPHKSDPFLTALKVHEDKINSDEPKPTEGDKLCVRLSDIGKEGSKLEQSLGREIEGSARYQAVSVENGMLIERDREAALVDLSKAAQEPDERGTFSHKESEQEKRHQKVLERIYTAFTDKEIRTMVTPGAKMSKEMPAIVSTPQLAGLLPSLFGGLRARGTPSATAPNLSIDVFKSAQQLQTERDLERDRDGPSMGFL